MPPLPLLLLLFLASRYTRRLCKSCLMLQANWSPKPEYLLDDEEKRVIYKRACFKVHRQLLRRHWFYHHADDACFAALVALWLCWPGEPAPQTSLVPDAPLAPVVLENRSLGLPDCLTAETNETYCRASAVWDAPVRDAHRWTLRYRAARDPAWRRHFVDAHGERFFTQHALLPGERSGVVLVSAAALVRQLERLRAEEATRCVCALHLGLLDNVAFHLRVDHWLLLHDAQPARPAADARLVSTRVTYAPGSALAAFEETAAPQPHHDAFPVVYSEASYRLDEEARATLARYDESVEEGGFILRRLGAQEVERVRLPLAGDGAACFLYCRHLTGAYPH